MKRYPSCILATCVLPWQADYSLDEELFRQQVRLLRGALTDRLYLFGTAGEGYAVSDEQFEEIVRIFRSELSGADDHPMVGVISLSLPTIVKRIEFCQSLGVRDMQISLPSWGALTDVEVDRFFAETCGRFPDCRFLHYNLHRSQRLLTGEDYARLSQAHSNLVAVKDGSTDPELCLQLLESAPELQFFFTEPRYARLRDQGECGLLISLAIVDFFKAKEFFEARGKELTCLGEELDRMLRSLVDSVGDAAHMDGAFDKMLIRTHLPTFPLRLLPPYASAGEGCFDEFRSCLPVNWHG